MQIIKVKDQIEGGQVAFNLFKEKFQAGANVFGLATGSTPLTFYQELVASDLDFSNCISINLDEYVGLSAQDEQSYARFMEQHLFKFKPFKQSHLPNGLATNPDKEIRRYDNLIKEYPIDLQILGIGQNGHIGFNEPGTPFDSTTHLVDLAESTIAANARFFADKSQVPRQAYSMGIASIMSAKSIVLMAYGLEKADAIYGMVYGQVTPDLPASVLQSHPEVYLILDEAAASRL